MLTQFLFKIKKHTQTSIFLTFSINILFFTLLVWVCFLFWRVSNWTFKVLRFPNSVTRAAHMYNFINGKGKAKVMFGNWFFPLFFVSKNNFLFLRLKNLFGNPKWTKNKNCSQNSICEGNWKHIKCCFQFLLFKSQWKHAFNLMNLSHLMS